MSDGIMCPKCGADKVQKQGKKRGRQMIRCQVCNRYSVLPESGQPTMAQPTPIQPSSLVTLAKVIEKYDIPAAIRREIAKLPKGQFILESELSQRTAGRDKYRFNRAIENNSVAFKTHRIKLRFDDGEAKWYWAGADDIAEALRIRDL